MACEFSHLLESIQRLVTNCHMFSNFSSDVCFDLMPESSIMDISHYIVFVIIGVRLIMMAVAN